MDVLTGEELYREWLGDPEGKTDAARYFPSMNPADQELWNALAAKVGIYRETLAGVRAGLGRWPQPSPAVDRLLATLDSVLAL